MKITASDMLMLNEACYYVVRGASRHSPHTATITIKKYQDFLDRVCEEVRKEKEEKNCIISKKVYN